MPSKTQSILIGALLIAVVGTLLTLISTMGGMSSNQMAGSIIGCITCILYIVGGLTAVWHYTSTNSLTMESGPGALLGMTTGAVGAIIAVLLGLLLQTLGITPTAEEVFAAMENSGAFDDMPAEQLETTKNMMLMFSGWLGWVVALIMGVIAGAIGGAIGAAMFKKGPAPEAGY